MLHYEVKGSGNRTLVCLHGFLESLVMWETLPLEKYARLLLIDLPGHGKSNLKAIDSMRTMAEAVRKIVDRESVDQYDIIGHSMGGYVALELKQIDSRCEQLVLLNSNVWSDSTQKQEDRKRVAKLVETKKERFVSEAIPNLFLSPENHDTAVASLVSEAIGMKSEAIGRASFAMSERADYSEAVFSGALELIAIQGEFDPVADKHRMEKVMQNQMDHFYVVHAGHMAHIEATEAVMEILQKILR
ncbi:MAG: alpha/beta hydrolase [Crocinitomicaceae bacterium]